MKYFIAVDFLLPFSVLAQDCKIEKEADHVSLAPKLTTGFIPFNAGINRTLLSIDATNKEIDFFFALNNGADAKCFDANSTATINFEGERMKANFKNTGSMNCEGLFHFTFKNGTVTPTILQRLGTKKVSSILFTGNNKTMVTLTLNEKDQEKLMNLVNCMITESKTLVK